VTCVEDDCHVRAFCRGAEFDDGAAEAVVIEIFFEIDVETEPLQRRCDIAGIVGWVGELRDLLILAVADDQGDLSFGQSLRGCHHGCRKERQTECCCERRFLRGGRRCADTHGYSVASCGAMPRCRKIVRRGISAAWRSGSPAMLFLQQSRTAATQRRPP
jgi:hypothetical protein